MKVEVHDQDSDDEKGAMDFLEIRDKNMNKAQPPKEAKKKEVINQELPVSGKE